ncbi:hypothetical protein D3C87_1778780 [compost metagenome]
MHAFYFRSVDEDFAERTWIGQAVQMFGIELERQQVTRRAIGVFLEVVGTKRGVDGVDITPQGAVFIEIWNTAQCSFDCLVHLCQFLQPLLLVDGRIEASLEQRENIP